MHEKRNFILILTVTVGLFWSGWAWFYASGDGFTFMRILSTLFTAFIACWLTYEMIFEDRLSDTVGNWASSTDRRII